MKIAKLVFNPIEENTYVLWDESNECIIVDPGNYSEVETQQLIGFISSKSLKPVMVLCTHGHFDHALGVEALRAHYNIPFALSSKDQPIIDMTPSGSVVYGMRIGDMPSKIDIDLDAIEQIRFGQTTLKIIECPGHTPGHISLFNEQDRTLLTGDTIFKESIGRTDLPGGDYHQLMHSITKNIITLGDDVEIFPGHGGSTSIGQEVLYNPFIVEVINKEVNY